jgi:ligand-binding sensor domain-containing protein
MKRFKVSAMLAIMLVSACFLFAQAVYEDYKFGPSNINALLKSGNLLYMATDNGLMVQNTADNSIQHYHLGNSPISTFKVICLAKKSNGSIWIGTDNGLYRMTGGVISRYMASQLSGSISAIYVDSNDIIWFNGYKINQSETLVSANLGVNSPNTYCTGPNGAFWLGGNDYLMEWYPATGVQHLYNTTNSSLPDNNIRSIKCDSQGNIWILSGLGLTRITEGADWITYGGSYDDPLAAGLKMDIDAQDRLWIAKSTALLSFDGVNLLTYPASQLGVSGYPINSILCADTLFYGARGKLGKKIGDTFTVQPVYNTDLLNYNIFSIGIDSTSRLWITYDYSSGGSYPQQYTNVSDGQATHVSIPFVANSVVKIVLTDLRYHYAIVYNQIYKLDNTGWTLCWYTNNWIEKGVYRAGKAYFNPGNYGVYVHDSQMGWNIDIDFPEASGNYAGKLAADYQGHLWFLNNYNLVSYADSLFTIHPNVTQSSSITSICPVLNGDILLGKHDGTVGRYNGNHYLEFLSLPGAEEVMQIVYGDSGEIWFRTESAVFVWHQQSGLQTVVPLSNYNSILCGITKLPNGRMLICTKTGYFIYRYYPPTSLDDENYVSPISPAQILAYPNPSGGEMTIQADNGKELSRLKIYNLRGQLVRDMAVPSAGTIVWDGKNNHGLAVANGIYLLSAKVDGRYISRKIVIRR